MHVHTLSSRLTFYFTFIFAPLLGLIGILALAIFWHGSARAKGDVPLALAFFFLLFWCGLAALFITRVVRWKRVRIDTTSFFISNYFKQIQVPLSQLSGVRELRRFGPRTIALTFSPATAFGEVVRFRPHMYLWFWREHPVVAELKTIAAGTPLTPAELDQGIAGDRRRLLTGVALFSGFFAAFAIAVYSSLTHSEPYRLGLEALSHNAAVVDALGAPVEPGWLRTGQINSGLHTGCATLQLGLHGSHAKGDATIEAFKDNDQWHLYHVWLEPDGRTDRIEVLNEPHTGSGKRCAVQPGCQSTDSQPAQAAKAGSTSKCPSAS
jgi:ABC-type amino acid transport system permease subunit